MFVKTELFSYYYYLFIDNYDNYKIFITNNNIYNYYIIM